GRARSAGALPGRRARAFDPRERGVGRSRRDGRARGVPQSGGDARGRRREPGREARSAGRHRRRGRVPLLAGRRDDPRPDARGRRRLLAARRMSWPEEFSDRYEEWSAEMTADVPFYAGLAREADGPIAELAVGNGRVAIPVAQATGRTVIGVDISPG